MIVVGVKMVGVGGCKAMMGTGAGTWGNEALDDGEFDRWLDVDGEDAGEL